MALPYQLMKDRRVPSSLFKYLAQIDAVLLNNDEAHVPVKDRIAVKLAEAVNPDGGQGFDWLFQEAATTAKYIHHEEQASFTCFIFRDRSVLVLLQSGHLYAVGNGSAESLAKIRVWLGSHAIVG